MRSVRFAILTVAIVTGLLLSVAYMLPAECSRFWAPLLPYPTLNPHFFVLVSFNLLNMPKPSTTPTTPHNKIVSIVIPRLLESLRFASGSDGFGLQ